MNQKYLIKESIDEILTAIVSDQKLEVEIINKQIILSIFLVCTLVLFAQKTNLLNEFKPYIGVWEFQKIVGYSRVHISPEEAKKVIVGTVIKAKQDYQYEEIKWTQENFYYIYRADLNELGIKSGDLVQVKMSNNGIAISEFFYDVEHDEIIWWYDGVLFGGKRIK